MGRNMRLKTINKFIKSFSTFPYIPQHDGMDCGPSCLAMIAHFYGKKYSIQELREYCYLSRDGVSLLGIEDGANQIGFDTIAVELATKNLIQKKPLPCILHWDNNHFVILYKITYSPFKRKYMFHIMDPSHGKMVMKQEVFEQHWFKGGKGLALLLSPTDSFYKKEMCIEKKVTLSFLLSFLKPHKKEISILILGLAFSSLFTLIFPFLTQALIDVGIQAQNIHFIFIILLAQVFLFLGSTVIEIVRNWVLVFINSQINISIISGFLHKIIKLPFKFFDTKQLGDFSARINDHQRIEHFLTSQSLIIIFSSLNFIVFFFVLTYYDTKIILIYISLTTLSIFWSVIFQKKLKKIDYHRFRYMSENDQSIYEIINGIIEVKLNNIENYKISKWETKQFKLFNITLDSLKIAQIQRIGFDFINQLKNILVVFVASREVILGNITLGTLLSVSYIIGQMNGPLSQLIEFLQSWQYAKLSLERLNEVQHMKNEDNINKMDIFSNYKGNITKGYDIHVEHLYFQYNGPRSPLVLDDINFTIYDGKTTAIVGESGSGKTTLMKLLLKFYEPSDGHIFYGENNINDLSSKNLRTTCGVVMQDGYIFSDTIEKNIVANDQEIDEKRLMKAINIANLNDYIDSLPLRLKTTLAAGGNDISGGQKQRILIARAVYKNPHYMFLDEATSSLDAENEKIIYENLQKFLTGKTVLKIAHRLSTVKNADLIIVLKKGQIVEMGNHSKLVDNKSHYFNLIKNQLELSI